MTKTLETKTMKASLTNTVMEMIDSLETNDNAEKLEELKNSIKRLTQLGYSLGKYAVAEFLLDRILDWTTIDDAITYIEKDRNKPF